MNRHIRTKDYHNNRKGIKSKTVRKRKAIESWTLEDNPTESNTDIYGDNMMEDIPNV